MGAVIIIGGDRIEAEPGRTVADAFSSSRRYPDAYLFLIEGTPVPMDTVLEDGMSVKALRVASGG